MIDTYRKVLRILDRQERRRLYLLLAMFLVRGPVEVIGIASIMPFLAVLANPRIIETNAYFAAAYAYLGFSSTTGFLQFLGAGLFVLLVTLIGFEALTQYATVRFSQMRTYSLSCRLLSTYLHQPYAWFLNRHSADLGKSVLTEVTQVVDGALMPCLTLLSSVLVAAFVIALVVAVDPVVAVTAAALVGGSYGLIYFACRNHLSRIGADRVLANRQRYQLAQEATGGIKDVKVMGLEAGYVRRFRDPAHRFAKHQATNRIIAALPGFGLQALVYGGGLLLILWLLAVRDGDLSAILPVIGVYALAGQRLMPTLQKIFQSITALRFTRAALDSLYADIQMTAGQPVRAAGPAAKPLSLRERLELIDVRFTYPNADRPALRDLTLTIPANTTVGLVGPTGSGKTTAVDLILGLLLPEQGELRVDGTPITAANVRAWQRSVGYVPQHIFLTDDTVAANIAFGIPPAKVDMAAVERSARVAELHDFVVQELPQGYHTLVGERGVRLSGGQRQRIGIARALYHEPDVLILDEATSALDTVTERAVMDAVRNLSHRKTIIMIAHRLSTIEKCDAVFQLSAGRVMSHGKMHDLHADYSTHNLRGCSVPRESQK